MLLAVSTEPFDLRIPPSHVKMHDTPTANSDVEANASHSRILSVFPLFPLASILKLRFKINRKNTPRVYSIPAAERR